MGAARKAWNAADHPRGPGGKFSGKGSSGSGGRGGSHEPTPWAQLGPSSGKAITPRNPTQKNAAKPKAVKASPRAATPWRPLDSHDSAASAPKPTKTASRPAAKAAGNVTDKRTGRTVSGPAAGKADNAKAAWAELLSGPQKASKGGITSSGGFSAEERAAKVARTQAATAGAAGKADNARQAWNALLGNDAPKAAPAAKAKRSRKKTAAQMMSS